jgi:hypothetical protein
MSVYYDLCPPTKSEPTGCGIRWEPSTDNARSVVAGILTIAGKRNQCSYKTEEFAADEGRGFALFKLCPGTDKSETFYTVFLSPRSPQCDHCTCRGNQAHGHCRHVSALRRLLSNDWL